MKDIDGGRRSYGREEATHYSIKASY